MKLAKEELEADYLPEPEAAAGTACSLCGMEPVIGPLYDYTYKDPPSEYRCWCGRAMTKTRPAKSYTSTEWEQAHRGKK